MLGSTQVSGAAAMKGRDQSKATLCQVMTVDARTGKTVMKMVTAPPSAGEMLGETVRQRKLLGMVVCRIRNMRFWRTFKPWRDGAEVVRCVRRERAIQRAKNMELARQKDGMEKLVLALTAIMKGEMGVALLCLRLNMGDGKKEAEELRLAMEKRAEELNGALMQMQRMLVLIMKGAQGLAFIDMKKKFDEHQMTMAIREGRLFEAMNRLVLALTGIMKGEMGIALMSIRLNMNDERRAGDDLRLAMEKREEELKGALMQLQKMLLLIIKGECGVAFLQMRDNLSDVTLGAALRQEHLAGAIMQLQRMLLLIMKGECGVKFIQMRENLVFDRTQQAIRDARCTDAMNTLVRALVRIMKGEMGVALYDWRLSWQDSKQAEDELQREVERQKALRAARHRLDEQDKKVLRDEADILAMAERQAQLQADRARKAEQDAEEEERRRKAEHDALLQAEAEKNMARGMHPPRHPDIDLRPWHHGKKWHMDMVVHPAAGRSGYIHHYGPGTDESSLEPTAAPTAYKSVRATQPTKPTKPIRGWNS